MIRFFGSSKFEKNINSSGNKKNARIVFMNPHSYTFIFKDKLFFKAVKNCTNIFIDGLGIYFLIKIKYFLLNKKFNYKKITGFDYFNFIVNKSYNKNLLLIGTYETMIKIKNRILVLNPSCKTYILNAPFVENFEITHVRKIFKKFDKSTMIDHCFVGTGSPKQEKLIELIHSEIIKKK